MAKKGDKIPQPCPFCGCVELKMTERAKGIRSSIKCTKCPAMVEHPTMKLDNLYKLWQHRPYQRRILIGPQEFENMFGIPKGTQNQWRYRKFGPDYFLLGGHVKYRLKEVYEFIESTRIRCHLRETWNR